MNRGTKSDGQDQSPAMFHPRMRTNSSSDDAASAEHRRKLEALFSARGSPTATGAATPQKTIAVAMPRAFSNPRKSLKRTRSEYSLRLERLRFAREPNEIKEAVDVFLGHQHQLPDDMEILLKVLQHPSEHVLRDAIGQISSLIIQGRAGNTVILTDRLGDIATRQLEPATQLYIEGLQNQLSRLSHN